MDLDPVHWNEDSRVKNKLVEVVVALFVKGRIFIAGVNKLGRVATNGRKFAFAEEVQ